MFGSHMKYNKNLVPAFVVDDAGMDAKPGTSWARSAPGIIYSGTRSVALPKRFYNRRVGVLECERLTIKGLYLSSEARRRGAMVVNSGRMLFIMVRGARIWLNNMVIRFDGAKFRQTRGKDAPAFNEFTYEDFGYRLS